MTKHEIAPRRPQLESDWGEKSSSFRRILFFRENAILQITIFFREINFLNEEILHFFFREIKSNFLLNFLFALPQLDVINCM